MKLLAIIIVDFDITDQLLTRYSVFVREWRNNGNTMWQCTNYLWTFKEANGSDGKEILYKILNTIGWTY